MFKKQEAAAGAPAWMVTYGDMMSLLLCFFIALVSMGEIRKDRFRQAMDSIHRAFGGGGVESGAGSQGRFNENTLIGKLQAIDMSVRAAKPGDNVEEGNQPRKFQVTSVRDGLRIAVAGPISFDRFGAVLRPEAREIIAKSAEQLRGFSNKLVIVGHGTQEPLPVDSAYRDARDLSYARAVAVADELERGGVRRSRMRLLAAGDTDPLVKQAYTEEQRALNRRVEVFIKEELIDEFDRSEPAEPSMESSDVR